MIHSAREANNNRTGPVKKREPLQLVSYVRGYYRIPFNIPMLGPIPHPNSITEKDKSVIKSLPYISIRMNCAIPK
jgi:hypothetical protein